MGLSSLFSKKVIALLPYFSLNFLTIWRDFFFFFGSMKIITPTNFPSSLLSIQPNKKKKKTLISFIFSHLFFIAPKITLSVCLAKIKKPIYFYYYLWVSLYFLVLLMSLTVLLQLTFTFIYSTFSKKISILTK